MTATEPPGLYFYHPACLLHDPCAEMPWAVETPPRLQAVEDRLQELDWLDWEPRMAPAASESQIELIHSAAHVDRIRELAVAGGGSADAETWVGEESYRAALHAADGASEMARALIGARPAAASAPCAHLATTPNAIALWGFAYATTSRSLRSSRSAS